MPDATTPWSTFADAEAAMASAVAERFAANLHHVLGTLAGDGAPRLSGLEVPIRTGHLWLGMMPGSAKCADLRRDPRFAVHSAPLEEDLADGDAKVDATAVEVHESDPEWRAFLDGLGHDPTDEGTGGGMALFVADIRRVTLTRVADDILHVSTWTPARGLVAHEIQ